MSRSARSSCFRRIEADSRRTSSTAARVAGHGIAPRMPANQGTDIAYVGSAQVASDWPTMGIPAAMARRILWGLFRSRRVATAKGTAAAATTRLPAVSAEIRRVAGGFRRTFSLAIRLDRWVRLRVFGALGTAIVSRTETGAVFFGAAGLGRSGTTGVGGRGDGGLVLVGVGGGVGAGVAASFGSTRAGPGVDFGRSWDGALGIGAGGFGVGMGRGRSGRVAGGRSATGRGVAVAGRSDSFRKSSTLSSAVSTRAASAAGGEAGTPFGATISGSAVSFNASPHTSHSAVPRS